MAEASPSHEQARKEHEARLAVLRESDPLLRILTDPLSETSRRTRRFLLTISAITIVSAATGIVPTEIFTLGIEITAREGRYFYVGMLLALVYSWTAFYIQSRSDLIAAEQAYRRADWFFKDETDRDLYTQQMFLTLIARETGYGECVRDVALAVFDAKVNYEWRRRLEFHFPLVIGALGALAAGYALLF